MKKSIALSALALVLVLSLILTGCGGSNAPGEKEVGAPVYPGAEYVGTGNLKTTHKYTSTDTSTKIVAWYREKTKNKTGFMETNNYKEAVTGNAINYSEDSKTVWITILPGSQGKPSTIEISVTKLTS